ncbi:hypothetical protein EBR56_04905, partial [bacterium]|nr:hypothetical protein [bacterium]
MDAVPPPKGPSSFSSKFGPPLGMPVIVVMILAGLALVTMFAREQAAVPATISYDEFVRQVQAGNVSAVEISGNALQGEFRVAPPAERIGGLTNAKVFRLELSSYLGEGLDKLLLDHSVKTTVRQPSDGTGFLLGLYMLVPLLLMAGFWLTLRRARDPLAGGGFLGSFSKSPAKRYG